MKKILSLWILLIFKISNALAYHGTGSSQGGSTLPLHEETGDNILYVLLPFIGLSLLINEILQFLLERKYSNTTLKDAKDLNNYTVIVSIAIVFLALFTRIFHGLPHLSLPSVIGIIISLFAATLAIKYREYLIGLKP